VFPSRASHPVRLSAAIALFITLSGCGGEVSNDVTCVADQATKVCRCFPFKVLSSPHATVVSSCSGYPCCYAHADGACQCIAELGGTPLDGCTLIQAPGATKVAECPTSK
jgi:hypothetical protein